MLLLKYSIPGCLVDDRLHFDNIIANDKGEEIPFWWTSTQDRGPGSSLQKTIYALKHTFIVIWTPIASFFQRLFLFRHLKNNPKYVCIFQHPVLSLLVKAPVRIWVAPGSRSRNSPAVWGWGRTSSSTCWGYDPSRCWWPLPPALQTSPPAPAHERRSSQLGNVKLFKAQIWNPRLSLKNLPLEIGDRQSHNRDSYHSVGGLW